MSASATQPLTRAALVEAPDDLDELIEFFHARRWSDGLPIVPPTRERVLRNAYDWEAELLELRVDDQVPLTLKRGSRELTVTVRIADLPEVSAQKVSVLKEIELISLTPAIRSERGIRRTAGAVVATISARVADELGRRAGIAIGVLGVAACSVLLYSGGRVAVVV